ncbi:unnamed protein product [Polarella glacialis]|uniref:WD40 repeat domain-containing protein n=1 Tax=Polarella glacialis TaxID=89957 RepID=A0A813EKS0_POLGL|nr:unnamed protein product [Polarella glacialis]
MTLLHSHHSPHPQLCLCLSLFVVLLPMGSRVILLITALVVICVATVNEEAAECLAQDSCSSSGPLSQTRLRVQSLQVVSFIAEAGDARSMAFSPDGSLAVTGHWNGTVKLWRSDGRFLRALHGHAGVVLSVAFSQDGTRLLSGGADQTARLWDVESGQEMKVMRGHSGMVVSVAVGPLGDSVLTGSSDRTAILWNASSGEVLRRFGDHEQAQILTSSGDNSTRLWRGGRNETAGGGDWKLRGHKGWVVSAAFSTDATTVLTGSHDNTVRLWSASSGKQLRVLRGHEHDVLAVALSDDRSLALSGARDGTVMIWDTATASLLRTIPGSRHVDLVAAVSFNPDSSTVYLGLLKRTKPKNPGEQALAECKTRCGET